MGCDMKWYVERQCDDRSWEHCPQVEYDGRDYTLFTALADVRHEDGVQIMSEPRGMPMAPSAIVSREWDYSSYGSYCLSWHSLDTLLAYDWEGNNLSYFRRMLNKMSALGPPDRVRAVFWFSS